MAKGVYDHSKNKGSTGKHWKIADTSKMRGHHPKSEFKKGMVAWNTGLAGYNSGDQNYAWKGDDVGKDALHSWAKRRLVKPNICEHCYQIKPLDLANKSREYKRDLNDWLWLCRKCHAKYDDYVNKSWATKRRIAA